MNFEAFSLVLYWLCTVGGLLIVASFIVMAILTIIVRFRGWSDALAFKAIRHDEKRYSRLFDWVTWRVKDEEVQDEFIDIFRGTKVQK